MYWQDTLALRSSGRGTLDISRDVADMVKRSGVRHGLCHLFIRHTSASLIVCENADPAVRHDLETFMAKLSPDGDPTFTHRQEGEDDMAAHIRSVITQTEMSVPVVDGLLALGTWQGIYLWEHRTAPHQRQVIVTVHGK